MNTRCLISASLLLGLSTVALAAPMTATDPESLPKGSCTDLKFSAAFLAKYPKAPAACQEVRIQNGTKYAKFSAKVFLVDPEFVTVSFLNVAGDPLTTFSFKPRPGAVVKVGGKDVKYSDLKKDDALTFWMPEDGLKVRTNPASTDDAWQVLPPR